MLPLVDSALSMTKPMAKLFIKILKRKQDLLTKDFIKQVRKV